MQDVYGLRPVFRKWPEASIISRMEKKPQQSESRGADKYIVRFPEGMRDRIAAEAKAANRSMNAEIVRRLELSLAFIGEPVTLKTMPVVSGDIPYSMAQDIARLAADANVSFDQMLARIFVAGIHPDSPQVVYLPVLPGAVGKDVGATIRAMEEFIRPDATVVSEMITRWSTLVDIPAQSKKSIENDIQVTEQIVREPRARRMPKPKG